MVDAQTKILGVIGDPIEHSLSPLMHNFILKKIGMNFCYHAFRVTDSQLPEAVAGARALNFRGLNVTLPHKTRIVRFLDEIHDEADDLEAVNTVLFSHGKMLGFNTDVIGFMLAVRKTGVDLAGKKAILIGAGGSAKAVALGLLRLGSNEISIYNRNEIRAQITADFLKKKSGSNIFSARALSDWQLYRDVENAAILVNATSVGMYPDFEQIALPEDLKLNPEILVFDLVYNPIETALLKFARSQGAKAENGLDMLIYQGVASEKIWMGRELDVSDFYDELKKTIIEALEKNGTN